MKLTILSKTELVLLIFSFLMILSCARPANQFINQAPVLNCFPDYRPVYKCLIFEKLP